MILSPAFVWISRRPGARSRLVNLALIRLSDGILTYYFLLFAGAFIGSNKVAGRDGATLSAPGTLRMGRLPPPEKNKAPYLATRCRVNSSAPRSLTRVYHWNVCSQLQVD